MKIKTLLAAGMMLAVLTANAQTFKYETLKDSAYFKCYDSDMGENCYFTNQIELQLPKSCSNTDIDIDAVRGGLLKAVFGDKYFKYSSTSLIHKNIHAEVITEGYDEYNWQPCRSIPEDDDYMNQWSASTEVTPLGLNDDVLFFMDYGYEYGGGAHGMASFACIGIDITNGDQVAASRYFTTAQQKAIMRMISTATGVKKYIDDATYYGTEECKELASGIKDILNGEFYFPQFYILDGNLHLHFQPYEIGYYALGAPEFIIPMSVATKASTATTTTKRTTTTRRRTTRRR